LGPEPKEIPSISRLLSATAWSTTLLVSVAATAAECTVTLAVDGMTCTSCPSIVRTALQELPGVARAEVSYAENTAVVTFDDAEATVATLTQATPDVGFPSRLAE
jgi:periplasmic mercuric ion binding protein